MRRTFVVACLLLISWFISSSTQAGPISPAQHPAVSVHDGEQVFIKRCLQCHSVNEGQTRFGPSLYREMKGSHPKKTSSQIRAVIKDGKGKMPPFGEFLTQEDTINLMAYLQTI
jgi:mono/diheme cytochrome c family protein